MNVFLRTAELLREHAQVYRSSHTDHTGRIDDAAIREEIAEHERLAMLLEHAAATLGVV